MLRFALIVASSAALCFLLLSLVRNAIHVGDLRTEFPKVIYDAKTDTSNIEIVRNRPKGWTPLESISPIARESIVISEDAAFWTHHGFDWNQMWDALQENVEEGRYVRGASTISQQVVKNVYLSKEKTILRKVKEAILTMLLERRLKKNRILEIYLNVAELGPGVFGIGNASVYYFKHSAATLNAKEGAFLAMLLPSPKRYGVSYRKKALTPFAQEAIQGILDKLVAVHRLSPLEEQSAISAPLAFETKQVIPMPPNPPKDEEDETEAFFNEKF